MNPSELIRLAVNDLEKCEADPRYVIDMDSWHEPFGEKCHVCLAGAVMAQTKAVPISDYECGTRFDDEWEARFEALDEFRRGHIHKAMDTLGYDIGFDKRMIISYEDDPNLFKQQMRDVADDLERKGY